MAALKILTLNTANTLVLGGLLSIIRIENPDIVFLQEITITSGQLKLYVAKYGYSAEANTDLLDITSLGTGIIWKTELPVTNVTSVIQCRAQVATLGQYSLLNVYAPSGANKKNERRDFFGQEIFRLCREILMFWSSIWEYSKFLGILSLTLLANLLRVCKLFT